MKIVLLVFTLFGMSAFAAGVTDGVRLERASFISTHSNCDSDMGSCLEDTATGNVVNLTVSESQDEMFITANIDKYRVLEPDRAYLQDLKAIRVSLPTYYWKRALASDAAHDGDYSAQALGGISLTGAAGTISTQIACSPWAETVGEFKRNRNLHCVVGTGNRTDSLHFNFMFVNN